MKRWQKTKVVWDCFLGLDTIVPVTDWCDDTKYLHKIHGVTATSMPDREVLVSLDIRRVAISPTTERQTVVRLIQAGIDKFGNTQVGKRTFRHARLEEKLQSGDFEIRFKLIDGAQFCDAAIELVRAVFTALGIEDESGYYLNNFMITQETFVEMDGVWIPFVRWMRINHRLPPFASCDPR